MANRQPPRRAILLSIEEATEAMTDNLARASAISGIRLLSDRDLLDVRSLIAEAAAAEAAAAEVAAAEAAAAEAAAAEAVAAAAAGQVIPEGTASVFRIIVGNIDTNNDVTCPQVMKESVKTKSRSRTNETMKSIGDVP
jgi:predicted NBD/HSP70 family sugar kinase